MPARQPPVSPLKGGQGATVAGSAVRLFWGEWCVWLGDYVYVVLFGGLHNYIMVNYDVALQIGAYSGRQVAAPTPCDTGAVV